MRVLLDACVPERLRFDLASAGTIETARFAGLAHLTNGKLLTAMAGRYDVLLTCDQSIQYQNVIAGRTIAVIVMRAQSNRSRDLRPFMPAVLIAITTIQPGNVIEI